VQVGQLIEKLHAPWECFSKCKIEIHLQPFAVGKGQQNRRPREITHTQRCRKCHCLTLRSRLSGIQLSLFQLARNLHKLQQRQQLRPCVDDVLVVLGQKSCGQWKNWEPAASPTLIYLAAKCLWGSTGATLPYFFVSCFWQPAQLSSLSPKRLSLTQGLFLDSSLILFFFPFFGGKWTKFLGNLLVNCGPFSALACVIAEYFQMHYEKCSS